MPLPVATINSCIDAVRQAGILIMQHYKAGLEVRAKTDKSPVTDADMASHHYLLEVLSRLTPDIPVVSEEAPPPDAGGRFWLVDPLDGTKSFIRRDGQFTVNLGLVDNRVPKFGILGLPVEDVIYFGAEEIGAWKIEKDLSRNRIHSRIPPAEGLTMVKSASHPSPQMKDFIDQVRPVSMHGYSSALKFALIAEGYADIYPRFGRTMEWDTAAGHAIVNAAGGRVETDTGEVLQYGKPHFENGPFIAYGYRNH